MQAIVLGDLAITTERGGAAPAEQAAELWPPPYCGAAMPAYGCCANPLHPLVLGPAPSFPRRPPRTEHVRGLAVDAVRGDRKSTRLNSSHGYISYAVFCLKKKKICTNTALHLCQTLATH